MIENINYRTRIICLAEERKLQPGKNEMNGQKHSPALYALNRINLNNRK